MKKLIHFSMLVLIVFQSFLPAIDVFARAAGETLFSQPQMVEPQENSTATPTPQDEATATPTETPLASETPLETETVFPTETPQPPTAEASVTPIPSPTEGADLATPEKVDGQQYQILLEADPVFATPGGKITVSWNIPAVVDAVSIKLQLVFLFSPGMFPDPDEKQEGVFDNEKRTYTLPASAQGKFKLVIDEKAQAPLIIEAVLVENEQVIGTGLLDFPERTALSREGGKVTAFNGNLKIRFSKDSVPADAEVLVGRVTNQNIPTGGLVGAPFEVTVYTLPTGKAPQSLQSREVKKFKEPLVFEIAYEESAIRGDERDLQLFYWNTEVGSWFTVPSSVDPEENILTGYSDHLTVFGMGINDFQIAKLPTLEGFQVSEFTGAATYSYPLDLPAGPGGLQPQLSLNYNSQVVDQATGSTQASWVGFGWSLDVPGIERNTRGTNFDVNDDTFSISVNGIGGMLLPGADGYYHTSEESFVRIQAEKNSKGEILSWTAWDKIGNKYYFGERVHFTKAEYINATNVWREDMLAWRWSLSWMENIHGQKLQYSYFNQMDEVDFYSCNNNTGECKWKDFDTYQAVYPSVITYPGGRTRVMFEYSGVGERKDYDVSWNRTNILHERYFLKAVVVQRDLDGNASFETTIRRYDLAYETDPNKAVLPTIRWNHGSGGSDGHNLTLKSITEKGVGGTQALPAVTFTYGDKMHLTEVNNGYGGKVVFTYEQRPWYAVDTSKSRTIEHIYGNSIGNYCNSSIWPLSTGGWSAMGGSSGFGCAWNGLSVGTVGAYSDGGIFSSPRYLPWTRPLIKPGSYFRLTANIFANGAGTKAKFWISDGETGLERNISAGNATLFDDVLFFDADSQYGFININTNGGARLADFKLRSVPSIYRVVKKEVYDGQSGHVQDELSYSYEGASMNTPAISAAAATAFPYIEAHSEFRGHARITVFNEQTGIKTITTYCQSDDCKGRPVMIETVDAIGVPLQKKVYGYGERAGVALNPVPGIWVYPVVGRAWWQPVSTGLEIVWGYTEFVESYIYASDGSYSATREVYSYESPYGNQTRVDRQEKVGDTWQTAVSLVTGYYLNLSGVYLVGLPRHVLQYNAQNNLLGATHYAYDGLEVGEQPTYGRLTTVRNMVELLEPDDRNRYQQTSYEYDPWGNRKIEKSWSGYGKWNETPTQGARVTETEYDTTYHTYPISVTNPLNQTVAWTYDYNLGVPLNETDPNGAVTSATYDNFGRMTKLIRPGDDSVNPTIKIVYKLNPFRVELSQKIEGAKYLTLRRYYDGMGRQFKTETGNTVSGLFSLYNTVETLFDSATVTRQSVPYGPGETPVYSTSETRYEGGTKISLVSNPDGSQTTSVTNGLTTTATDPAGRFTISRADAWGRTISVTPPEGPGVTYAYDLLGRLLTATRGDATTSLSYDIAGRKIGMSDPDMGDWYYQYDALGNLIAQVDAKKQAINLCYDSLNRLVGKTYTSNVADPAAYQRPDCPPLDFYTVRYDYDQGINGKGRRTGMQDASSGSGSTAWVYDARGRMTLENKVIEGQTYTTQWTYNSADLPVTMIYPDGEVVTNTYTSQMLLDSVAGDLTYVFDTQYDSAGRMTKRRLGGELPIVNPPAPLPDPIFSDVPADHWARREIEGLYTAGVVGNCGTSPLRYCPGNPVTRANAAVDILRAKYGAAYQPPNPASQRFTDVPVSHPAYAWIDKFAEDGITAGCGSGNFCPDDATLRIQMIIFLLRAKHGGNYVPPAVPAGEHYFADMIGNSTEAWAVAAKNEGITDGCDGGVNFCPNQIVTREMEAVLIARTFNIIPPPSSTPGPEPVVSPVIEQNYNYYAWDQQGGRLQTLNTTGLQNLTYQYDLAGNITQIQDALNTETQSFGYDNLDRLTGWTRNGAVQETYGYDPSSGNLAWRDAGDNIQPVLDPMLVDLAAWWGLDETSGTRANQHANDSLIPQGTVAVVPSQKGNSASFSSATPGHLRQEDNPRISTGNISFTLAAQVYLTNLTGTGIIANKGEKMNMNRRDYTLFVSSGVITFRVGDGSSTVAVSTGTAVAANVWHTVVGWYDAENDKLYLQVDNGPVNSVDYAGGASDTDYPLTVGAFADNTYVLNGRVDELALYKRILTVDERAWLHNSGQGRAYAEIPEPVLPPGVDLVYAYNDSDHAHAVTGLIPETGVANTYTYDENGNQKVRNIDGDGSHTLLYDAENRLVEVEKDRVTIAAFTYDGDGRQVKSVIDGVTTLYVGAHYEKRGSEITKYYFAGASRVAMRRYTIPVSMEVEFLLGDHLGSTSLTVDSTGVKTSEIKYTPWGEIRSVYVKPDINSTPAYRLTNYTFTGQRSYMDDPTTTGATEGFGLMFYNARWYDPQLGRFAQADSIVPGGVQGLDRYAYVNNNPLRHTDPSGHSVDCGIGDPYCAAGKFDFKLPKPSNQCIDDGDCYDAYITLEAVSYKLGRPPSLEEMLYMTAATEYLSRTGHPGVREFGQEGLARNYYEQCNSDGCQGDELYKFLAAYEPWSDWKGANNNQKTPAQRADRLVGMLDKKKSWLWDDVSRDNGILNLNIAESISWTDGKWTGKPWQWFGPFTPSKTCRQNVTAAISVDTGNGTYFWMVNAEQDAIFSSYCP